MITVVHRKGAEHGEMEQSIALPEEEHQSDVVRLGR
jgi:hypothetical protein